VNANSKKLTLDQYKLQALEHGAKCIADEYLGAQTPILHQCLKNTNHSWLVCPSSIRRGHGCPYCARIKVALSRRLTLDQYKLQALEHGVRCIANAYVNDGTPILHQCLKDQSHEWLASPCHIKQDHGCPHCTHRVKITLDQYKLQALEHGVRCIADKYMGANVPILHQCLKDPRHEWKVRPNGIKRHKSCPYCVGNIKLTLDQYKLQALEHGARCIADVYINNITPVLHQCLKDSSHVWNASPGSIKQNHGCPYCNSLKQEPRCRIWFERFFQRLFPKIRPKWLLNHTGHRLELDGYCEELKLAFEYNGIQHYEHRKKFHKTAKAFKLQQQRDTLKLKLCVEHGVKLIIISYNDNSIEDFLEDYFAYMYMAL
jgi:hypothetical protein